MLRMFCTASFPNSPLRMALTACRKDRQGICDHLVHFLSGFCATVDLVEHLSVLDKKNSGCVAGCLCTVGYHENSLAFLIHLIEHGKKVGRRTGVQCSSRYCVVSKNDSFVQFCFSLAPIRARSGLRKRQIAQKKRAEQGTAPCPVLFYFLILFLQITL